MLRGKWRSPIYLPKKFSRLAPVIKEVRVERVQDITDNDAKAEGLIPHLTRMRFSHLWNSINAKKGYGWDTNPWVWVIEFEVIKNG